MYAGHDYKGWAVSTIGESKTFNPRLAGRAAVESARTMNSLRLPSPRMMDVTVVANLACGKRVTG